LSKHVKGICVSLGLLSLLMLSESTAMAQRATTNTTFSSPVQLSGVLLPAGAYQFAVAGDRRSIIVSDAGRRIVATLMVVPVTRAKRGNVVVMRPANEGAAPEVSALFLDGGRNGFEFVRPAPAK
jgi:hypothetical protein